MLTCVNWSYPCSLGWLFCYLLFLSFKEFSATLDLAQDGMGNDGERDSFAETMQMQQASHHLKDVMRCRRMNFHLLLCLASGVLTQ